MLPAHTTYISELRSGLQASHLDSVDKVKVTRDEDLLLQLRDLPD